MLMIGFVIRFAGLPNFPGDREPAVGEATIGVAGGMGSRTDRQKVGFSPVRLSDGIESPLLSDVAKLKVTGFTKANRVVLTTTAGDRASACQGL